MKKVFIGLIATSMISMSALADTQSKVVQSDIDAFQDHFKKTFPDIDDFSKGPYVFNADKRSQFEEIMELPPFEDFVEKGKELWNKRFSNGSNFASCFNNDSVEKIRTQFPRWNVTAGKVETLEAALNECRVKNGEGKWGWKKGNIAYVSAYLTTAAEGQIINVIVPEGDEKALAAYNDGKEFYYAKRGQLNMSCADCHVYNPSKRIRGDILSASVGQLSHFPVWRGKWAKNSGDGFGTIQRRYGGCNKQVRAKPFKTQKSEYSNLEYFHTAMSNGTEITGTEYRH